MVHPAGCVYLRHHGSFNKYVSFGTTTRSKVLCHSHDPTMSPVPALRRPTAARGAPVAVGNAQGDWRVTIPVIGSLRPVTGCTDYERGRNSGTAYGLNPQYLFAVTELDLTFDASVNWSGSLCCDVSNLTRWFARLFASACCGTDSL